MPMCMACGKRTHPGFLCNGQPRKEVYMPKKIVAKPAPKPSKSRDSSAKLKAVKPSKKYGK